MFIERKNRGAASRDPELGSSALTVLAALVSLGLAGLYVQQQNAKSGQSFRSAKVQQAVESLDLNNMNAVAAFKALLAPNSSNGYLPGIYAGNYFQQVWQLRKNPSMVTDAVENPRGSRVEIKSLSNTSQSEQKIEPVLSGAQTQIASLRENSQVQLIKANFAKNNPALVESVDVRVTTSTLVNGQNQRKTSLARVPVPAPIPRNPILEVSPHNLNQWSRDVSTVGTGNYDVRVLGSGVVYKAVITVNGGPPIEVGGFDPQTGEVTHQAVHVLAADAEIGRFTYSFGAFKADASNCDLNPVDGNYNFKVALIGPDGTTPEGATLDQTIVSKADSKGGDLTEEEFKAACDKECPYYEEDETEAARTEQIVKNKFDPKDMATPHNLGKLRDQIGTKSIKTCENMHDSIAYFAGQKGRLPTDQQELGNLPGAWERLIYTWYNVPECKRHFLFQRGACGCFAEETLITLGDGQTQKPINQLTSEDRVWNPILKKAQGIRRVTRGPETIPMLAIRGGDKELKVTGHHPFPTKRGLLPAHELKEGDAIQLGAEEWVTVASIQLLPREGEAPVVWNLELDGNHKDERQHYVLANGVVTGDLYIQSQLQKAQGRSLAQQSP